MKKSIIRIFIFLIFLLISVFPAYAGIDPILVDEPNENVYQCGAWLFFEPLGPGVFQYNLYGQRADNFFFTLKAEVLFLEKYGWKGLDKNSFVLVHTGRDGEETEYPLDYIMSSFASLQYGWKTLADPLNHTYLMKYILVFDVPVSDKQSWKLIFQPSDRGKQEYCRVEIPLRTK